MTLQQLRYLLAVVEHGGMTAAAQALFVDQSALSRALQALERELRTELFVRSGRGVAPTPEGARIAHLAKRILTGVRAIEDTFAPADIPEPTGRLVLGSTQSLAIELITTILPPFRNRHPRIGIDVQPYESPDLAVEALRENAIDMVMIDLPVPSDLRVQPFAHHEIVLVSPPGLQLPDPVAWPDMQGLPMIMPAAGSVRRRQFDQLFSRHEIQPEIVMETDERGAWVSCVAAGHGSLLWYRDLATRFASTVAIRSLSPPLLRTVALAWTRRPLSAEARALCAYAQSRGVQETEYI
ncbi:LysR family transcriptional regulator [Yinghuangia soli]|uniref:LysR family transcriptional regulator n=1 Tax=Yinghuangia soli TaxID=2908204 RepID=A0AA41PWZ0_9ACTN|nr:LysR family transcriptional regulator [Yinghuangia soli]MCF2527374.1 LysR family transcriptional regulator [Yinghuangia soli]